MEIFLDSASIKEIEGIKKLGILKGVTTNPSSIAQEASGENLLFYLKNLIKIISVPISIQIRQDSYKNMLEEAKRLSDLSENIVIKLSMNESNIELASNLRDIGIQVNMTLCFSLAQAVLAYNAGVSYVSLFLGRLDDIQYNGIDLLRSIRDTFNKLDSKVKSTKILAASIRHPRHFFDASVSGADVITIPYKLFNSLFYHPLSFSGNKKFEEDWDLVFKSRSYFK